MYKNVLKTEKEKKRLLPANIKGNCWWAEEAIESPKILTIKDNPSLSNFSERWGKIPFEKKWLVAPSRIFTLI